MGMVFGKHGVAEPTYKVLRSNLNGPVLPYEIRQYGERLAAETSYLYTDASSTSAPFRALASYIGVFGTPQNEGTTSIAMTAPVAMATSDPTPIAMTAPVAMKTSSATDSSQMRTMTFFLPAEYTTLQSVPKPTNPAVSIRSIPAATGAVHRFSGTMNEQRTNEIALKLAQQLREDGVESLTDEHVLLHREAWGYDPPFTLPPFRRNEVWINLSPQQVAQVMNKAPASELN
jgi:SOUL heme-binding protein